MYCSDRAQNTRSEALNLIRNRKGRLPHIVVVTEEPSPSRLPLVQKIDFERFAGSLIKLELKTPHEGSRRFRGILMGIEGDLVKVELEAQKEVAEFAYSDIQKARLIPDYETSKSN